MNPQLGLSLSIFLFVVAPAVAFFFLSRRLRGHEHELLLVAGSLVAVSTAALVVTFVFVSNEEKVSFGYFVLDSLPLLLLESLAWAVVWWIARGRSLRLGQRPSLSRPATVRSPVTSPLGDSPRTTNPRDSFPRTSAPPDSPRNPAASDGPRPAPSNASPPFTTAGNAYGRNAVADGPRPAPSGRFPVRQSPLSPTTPETGPPRDISKATEPAATASRARIFICYRREDSRDVVGRISDRLVERFGEENVFKDVDSTPLGVDFREHLNEVVSECDVLLAMIGPQWNGETQPGQRRLDAVTDFVRIELEAALRRKILVIPVLMKGAKIPEEAELPETVKSLVYRNGMEVQDDPHFRRDMDRLIKALENHLSKRP